MTVNLTTFKRFDRVYWQRPSWRGDGELISIPATVVGMNGPRVTIEAWGKNGTTRLVSVLPRTLKHRETIADVVDRLERKDGD